MRFVNFLKKHKQILICALKLMAISLTILFSNCMVFGFTNFGHLDVAEFISSNLSSCKKESKTGRVLFEMGPTNKIEPFFKNNKQAVAILSSIQNNSVFLTWDSYQELFYSEEFSFEGPTLYGVSGRGKDSEIPFDLKLISGSFSPDYFNTYNLNESDPINYAYISKGFCESLFPSQSFDDVIGLSITNPKLNRELIVAGVCSNESILNNYGDNDCYIVANHLNFSTKFEYEKMIIKIKDVFNTSYSLFKKIFYSESWIPPFSEKAYIKLNFCDNSWLENEAVVVYNNSSGVPQFIPLLFVVFYFVIGFCCSFLLFKSNIIKALRNLPFVCLSIFVVLFLFWLAKIINSGQVWFGIHIVGSPVYSLVYVSFGILLLIGGLLAGHYLKKSRGQNLTNNRKDYYQIDI